MKLQWCILFVSLFATAAFGAFARAQDLGCLVLACCAAILVGFVGMHIINEEEKKEDAKHRFPYR